MEYKLKSAKIFLHIGMQRTGTTFLQKSIFPYVKEINMVDFDRTDNGVAGNFEIKNIMNNIEKYDCDEISKKIYSRFKQNKINLISEENINCRMFTKEDKRYLKITKLKEFFPDAKILFGIRNKKSLLVSWYVKYVMRGGTASFNTFIDIIFDGKKLNYTPYIKLLYGLFGKKNVCIYRFEDLKKDVHGFVQEICNFIGVSVPEFSNVKQNVGYSLNQLKLALFFNHFFKAQNNPKGWFSIPEYYIPHRFLFQSTWLSQLPKKKITLDDLKRIG